MGISNAVRVCRLGNGASGSMPSLRPARATTVMKPATALAKDIAIQANSNTNRPSKQPSSTLKPPGHSTLSITHTATAVAVSVPPIR